MVENGKAKERTGIKLDLYPNWVGKRTTRYIGIQATVTEKDEAGNEKKRKINTDFRFDAEIPVPMTEEESMELFGQPLGYILELGATQHSYNCDATLRNMIAEDLAAGVDFGALEDPDKYAIALQDDMATPKERRISAATENKRKASKYDEAMKQAGVETEAELFDLIAKAKAAETGKKSKKA